MASPGPLVVEGIMGAAPVAEGCPFAGAALDRESSDLYPRRIVRFLDASGNEQLALQPQENGPASLLSGDLFNPDTLVDTGEVVKWPLSKG